MLIYTVDTLKKIMILNKAPMTLKGGNVIIEAVIWQIAPEWSNCPSCWSFSTSNGLVNTDNIIEEQEIQGRPPFCPRQPAPLVIVTPMQNSNVLFLTLYANQVLF